MRTSAAGKQMKTCRRGSGSPWKTMCAFYSLFSQKQQFRRKCFVIKIMHNLRERICRSRKFCWSEGIISVR